MSNTQPATASASVAVPLGTVLVVVLAVAKVQNLWGLGDLSWWWVFAPYWLPLAIFLGIIGVVVVVGFAVSFVNDTRKARKKAKRRADLQAQMERGDITYNEFRRRL